MALAVASLGMSFDGVARVQFSAFWAWERMELETLVTAVQETAYVVGTAVVLWHGGGPIGALAVFTASRAVGACGGGCSSAITSADCRFPSPARTSADGPAVRRSPSATR